MKNCLLFLAVVAALLVGAPAHSQYVFLDVNGDGKNSTNPSDPGTGHDALGVSTTSVDVYFVTNKNANGTDAVCTSSSDPFTIISYELTLLASGTGSVTYGTWTDNVGFTTKLTACGGQYCTSGPAIWLAFGTGTALPAGKYKVGSLAISVLGTPVLSVVPGYIPLSPTSGTTFGSNCLGGDFDNTIKLGHDFFDASGTEPPTATVPTTWGKIKDLYR